MRSILAFFLVTSSLLWAQAPASVSYADFEAAKAREANARAELERARAAEQSAEQEALRAANAELDARRGQLAELQRLDRQAFEALDRYVIAGERPQQLDIELDLLRRWYELYQPVVGHLTERSFVPITAELATLASRGVIAPGERRIGSYSELRARMVALENAIRQHQAEAEQQKAAIHRELEELARRRNALLAQLARPTPGAERVLDAWASAAQDADRKSEARAQAAEEVLRIYLEFSRSLEQSRPAVLAGVVATTAPNVTLYRGEWRRGDGTGANERERQQKLETLRARREQVVQAIETVEQMRRDFQAPRAELAERMHVRSRLLEKWTDRYSTDLRNQWIINTATDVGLTVAEVVVTGGGATLERKAEEAAQRAVEAAEARGAQRASPLMAALMERRALRGKAAAQAIESAAEHAERDAAPHIADVADGLIREGMDPRVARRQAAEMFRPAIEQIQQLQQLTQAARAARLEELGIRNELAAFPGGLGAGLPDFRTAATELGQEAVASTLPNLPELAQLARHPASLGSVPNPDFASFEQEFRVNSTRDVLIGEAASFGVQSLVNTAKAYPASAAAGALGRWARCRSFVGSAARSNVSTLGLSVVTGTIKGLVAHQTDVIVNTDVEAMADLYAELSFLYRRYYVLLTIDGVLHDLLAALTVDYSAIDQAIRELKESGYTLAVLPAGAATTSRDGNVDLVLTFSVPLLAPPAVRLGPAEIRLQADADGDGTRWRGSVPVRALGEGTHELSVSLSPEATPYGSLDRDPSTAAVRAAGSNEWSGFERGADLHHHVRIAFRPESAKSTEITAEDLVGRWVATGYGCDPVVQQQVVEISYSPWTGLTARKVSGDNCIHSDEVTWRNGQLSGHTVSAEFHTRAAGRSVWEEGDWWPATLQVISRDELRFDAPISVTYRRQQ